MALLIDRLFPQPARKSNTSVIDLVTDYSGDITTTAIPSSFEQATPSTMGRRVRSRLARSVSYAFASFPVTLLWLITFSVAFSVAFGLTFVGIGLLLLPLLLRAVSIAGHTERWVLFEVLDEYIEPPRRLEREPGLRGLFLTPIQDSSYWRELAFIAVRIILAPTTLAVCLASFAATVFGLSSIFWGWPNGADFSEVVLLLTLGVSALILGCLLVLLLTSVQVSLARALLSPDKQTLTTRANKAVHNRNLSVAAAEAERQRIERDLHDGAQARLATVALDLGRAKRRLEKEGGDDELGAIIDSAHNDAKQAIVELRNLARGIHPAVLTDRGLDAALSDVAARCTSPVHLDVHLLERPTPHIESAAYFAVCELLTNITKHSRATQAWVTVRGDSANLRIDVSDNGVGGAEHCLGSGLLGLHERINGIDGTIEVRSPLGGGTAARIELPMQQRSTGIR